MGLDRAEGHVSRMLRALALALAACTVAPTRPVAPARALPRSARAPEQPTRVPPPASTLEDRLHALAIGDDDFYRSVLYTWTSPTNVAELRTTRRLLVATASSGQFTSPFNRALAKLVAASGRGATIARMLATHPALIRRRYAWPAAFATVMGVGPRTYGNALIRIELRPQAWIGRFDPEAAVPFTFVDAHGVPVEAAAVLAEPERLAAIFHVRTDRGQAVRFREYVVCSSAMVAAWSVATLEIRAELDRELALLRELRAPFTALSAAESARPASPAWRHVPTTADLVTQWHAALAFDNGRYHPQPRQLDAILAALTAYDPAGPPLVVAP